MKLLEEGHSTMEAEHTSLVSLTDEVENEVLEILGYRDRDCVG
jgi:hypothetical protein